MTLELAGSRTWDFVQAVVDTSASMDEALEAQEATRLEWVQEALAECFACEECVPCADRVGLATFPDDQGCPEEALEPVELDDQVARSAFAELIGELDAAGDGLPLGASLLQAAERLELASEEVDPRDAVSQRIVLFTDGGMDSPSCGTSENLFEVLETEVLPALARQGTDVLWVILALQSDDAESFFELAAAGGHDIIAVETGSSDDLTEFRRILQPSPESAPCEAELEVPPDAEVDGGSGKVEITSFEGDLEMVVPEDYSVEVSDDGTARLVFGSELCERARLGWRRLVATFDCTE